MSTISGLKKTSFIPTVVIVEIVVVSVGDLVPNPYTFSRLVGTVMDVSLIGAAVVTFAMTARNTDKTTNAETLQLQLQL